MPRSTLRLGSLALLAALALPIVAESTDLPPYHQRFLDETALLLAPEEREAFLALTEDYRRDAFIRRFWKLRDPFDDTARNELEDRWEERAELARQRFGEFASDRARILLLNGEPADRVTPRCGALLRPIEIWRYPRSDLIGRSFSLIFIGVGPSAQSAHRLWSPTEGVHSLLLIVGLGSLSEIQLLERISQECFRGDDLANDLVATLEWDFERFTYPRPNPEWVLAFLDRSTEVPEDAAELPVDVEIDFPARYQSRTVVRGLLSLPTESVTPSSLGNPPTFQLMVDGEVLRNGDLFDSFRYRFELPQPELAKRPDIPLLLERYLRPGDYTLRLRVRDLVADRYFRHEQLLTVPVVTQLEATAPAVAPAGTVTAAAASAPPSSPSSEVVLRLLAPPPRLLVGRARFTAQVDGEGVDRVRFAMDGRTLLTKRRPPYSVEVDLGQAPRTHELEVVAVDVAGVELAADKLLLNAGPHRFAVRLVEPQVGQPLYDRVRARAEVEVPEGERLDRVEFYLNESLVATLYQPPFVQPVQLPTLSAMSYVRAVAYLVGGAAAEDLKFVNAPDILEEMDVHFVELFTTVVDRKGRPVQDLLQSEVAVFEDDRLQTLRRFEWVENLPIHAGVLLDTSTSMTNELEGAEQAALRFFENLITERDRAAVIVFNDEPNLEVRFTNRQEVLAGGLAGLVAEGETALYDSLVYALYYFSGIKGKRALVLLSDGEDSTSRYSFDEALEFARRSGVAIYSIGLNLPSKATTARLALRRLAEETGGRFFFISGPSNLEAIYTEIEKELRSQYLLAYQSDEGGDDQHFRQIEIKVSRSGHEAKTVRGYYP